MASATKPFWTGPRVMLTAAVLIVLGAAASALFQGPSGPPPVEVGGGAAPLPGRVATAPAPAPTGPVPLAEATLTAEFPLLDGKMRQLADYKGKVVVLDLWATWCGPCRVEIPHLIALGNEFKSKGVEVVGLSLEDPEMAKEEVRAFAREFKINYALGFAGETLASKVMRGGSIPQTIVIGRDGRVHKHFIGFNPRISPPQMRAAVEQAVNGAE